MKSWMSLASSWKVGRGGAPAAGAGRDQRHERAKAHGLQELLRHLHLERAVAAGLRRERDADRVADALLQQDAHRGRRGDDALRAHAGLGEAEMQRVVGARARAPVDGDQVLHGRDLGREDDPVARQARSPRRARRESSADWTIASRVTARASSGRRRARVLVHQLGQQLLVERAPVDADAHRLAVSDRQSR